MNTVKVKTADLTGAALDWAVCMAEGLKPTDIYISRFGKYTSLCRRQRDEDGNLTGSYITGPDLLFSWKWEAGGPIIERERIELHPLRDSWSAFAFVEPCSSWDVEGSTPLIAAMRCYVASKLGDVVEVPAELINSPKES